MKFLAAVIFGIVLVTAPVLLLGMLFWGGLFYIGWRGLRAIFTGR